MLLFGVGLAYQGVAAIVGVLVICEGIGWAIRYRYIRPTIDFFTHTVVVLAQAGQRSKASLDQLKTKREEIREQMTTPAPPPSTPIPGRRRIKMPTAQTAKTDAAARFDLGEPAAAAKPGDLHDALGGAQTTPTAQPIAKQAGPSADQPADESTVTSKLLEAKRRARREIEERRTSKE